MDSEHLQELFRRYGDDVFRLAYSYLGSRADAEDICQTVFMKLAEGNVRLLPGKEKNWLLTCAANASKNLRKSFWRRNVTGLEGELPFADPRNAEVHAAVMALPRPYRMVVHLYYFEGYDQGEIAQILHLSRTAVQTRMSRAREKLKKELSEIE